MSKAYNIIGFAGKYYTLGALFQLKLKTKERYIPNVLMLTSKTYQ